MNNTKFRHYDTRLNEMRYSDRHDGEFYVNTKGVMYMYAIPKSESGLDTKYYKSYDVEQFTGTKDSCGNEVYDGDIVSGFFIGIITWSDEDCGFWVMNINNRGGGMVGQRYMENFKVIGNIHQNPELLGL